MLLVHMTQVLLFMCIRQVVCACIHETGSDAVCTVYLCQPGSLCMCVHVHIRQVVCLYQADSMCLLHVHMREVLHVFTLCSY